MKGKKIVVTGGTTGIGRALVTLLAKEGARVATLGRDPNALREVIDAGQGAITGVAADIGTREGVDRLFDHVDAELGGLDAIVSNAALGADPIDEMAEDDWRYVVEVNLVGAMAAVRGALQRLKPGGQIVIVGSISAEIHAPGESVYSATKAGLQAFAETLRKEVAPRGLRVTLIEPGTVGTDMQESSSDEQREKIARAEMLAAEDIAETIAFALSRPDRVDIVALRVEPRLQVLP
jgi:NAD(P)-dependent dehydrogenase (short-subunit alcohol dehydrogenase family)